jgi:hypothetical protein
MREEIQSNLYAEYLLRVKLMEAENYRMLNQLRKSYPSNFYQGWHSLRHILHLSWANIGEKLEWFATSLASWLKYDPEMG